MSYLDPWTNRRRWYESEEMYVRRRRAESEQKAAEADARLSASHRQATQEKAALAQQLASSGAAIDAFVELSAVREELARYGRPQRCGSMPGARWGADVSDCGHYL